MRVIAGHVKEFGGAIQRGLNAARDLVDDERSSDRRQVVYDSVHGGPHRPSMSGAGHKDSRVRVVFRREQVYPAYLVSYAEDWGVSKSAPASPAAAAASQKW